MNHKFELKLSEVAKWMKYNLEVDSFDDVGHSGYNKKDIKNMNLSLPEKFDELDKVFPYVVANALEQAEREAIASAIRKHRLSALEDALLAIDLSGGGAEYQDLDGNMVSEKAGVVSVEIDESKDMITLEIFNPAHLLNSIINGVGMFAPDLDYKEQDLKDIQSKIHHLHSFFEVYGVRKPSEDYDSNYIPNIDDDYFSVLLEDGLEILDQSDLISSVISLVKEEDYSFDDALDKVTSFVKVDKSQLRSDVQSEVKKMVDNEKSKFEF